MSYLQKLRYYRPNTVLLKKLTQHRILSTSNPLTDKDLAFVLKHNADALVLTVSQKACSQVNKVALMKLFTTESAVADIQHDNYDVPLHCTKI